MTKRMRIVGLIVTICWSVQSLFTAQLSTAQDQASKARPNRQRQTPPAFEPPEADPHLPNVLLLGDSISIGYMLDVREQLSGDANVWRPAVNCGPTTRGLELLDQWIGDRKWDVIHFNFGLHDLKYIGPDGQNLANPQDVDSHPQVPIEQYAENLKQIAKRLQATGAILIWCETTPVPAGASGRVPGDAHRYNEAAARVMNELGGIQVDKLYDFALQAAEQRKANVHYTAAGSAKLAEQVAASIRTALDN